MCVPLFPTPASRHKDEILSDISKILGIVQERDIVKATEVSVHEYVIRLLEYQLLNLI